MDVFLPGLIAFVLATRNVINIYIDACILINLLSTKSPVWFAKMVTCISHDAISEIVTY